MSIRPIILALLSLFANQALAVGLGELRSHPVLGKPLLLEVEILGSPKVLDPACFSLRPTNFAGDVPNLRQATFQVRRESPLVLEIRSTAPLRDPIVQFAVRYSCEQDVIREYAILATPPEDVAPSYPVSAPPAKSVEPAFGQRAATSAASRAASAEAPVKPRRTSTEPRAAKSTESLPAGMAKGLEPARRAASPRQDRLMLSGGADVGEPTLRVATGLGGDPELVPTAADAERAQLRLEYRMLSLMQEMATTPASATDRLRELDTKLGELRKQMPGGPEAPGAPASASEPAAAPAQAPAPAPAPVANPAPAPVAPAAPAAADEDYEEYLLYGALALLLFGLLGLLHWRDRRAKAQAAPPVSKPFVPPVDPFADEPVLGGRKLVEPELVEPEPVAPERVASPVPETRPAQPMPQASLPEDSFMPLPGDDELNDESLAPGLAIDLPDDAMAPMVETSLRMPSLDEQYEVNPVMELADIMLSFGRVKGAAQALQEYVDKNPQDALQPWIRLLEVYRMAGMRDEFEMVAQNLNKNFNVEVLRWEEADDPVPVPVSADSNVIDFVLDGDVAPATVSIPSVPKPRSLEEMPRLMTQICDQWREDGVLEQLHLLLRDNRGGQRLGFTLAVVDEILFLIELKENIRKMSLETE